jgi:hypothetical protein
VSDLWQQLGQQLGALGYTLGRLVWELGAAFPLWPLLIVWLAWWLLAVNWRKTWPVLARGGWVPVVLLVVLAALVWSRVVPWQWELSPGAVLPNFWWQLFAVALLALSALFCGWLQGVLGRVPPEIDYEPPAPTAHGHDNGHEHGHH